MKTKFAEPKLMSNGCRERTDFNADYDFLSDLAFTGLGNKQDEVITEKQFLDESTKLALTCPASTVYARLKAGGYFRINDPQVNLKEASCTHYGIWRYRNQAMFTETEKHPVVIYSEAVDPIVCQQRPYEPTNELGVCVECPVRANLIEKGKDCLFASKFVPRENL